MPTPENQSPFDARRDHTTRLVSDILNRLAADVPASFICVYGYSGDVGELERIATYPADALTPQVDGQVQTILYPKLSLIDNEPRYVQDERLAGMGFGSAVVCGLMMDGDLIGLLGVHTQTANAYDRAALAAIRAWANLAESALQNQRLREDQAITQAIQTVAQVIGENPEAQDLVDLLHKTLLGAHISTCVMMFYGPLREDRPNGPFDYLEVRGSWSKRAGSGTAQGIKIYLDPYPDFVARLDERRVIAADIDEADMHQYDPFIRGLLRAEHICSMMWVALHAGQQRVGVIFVGTDEPHRFMPQEARKYRLVSEFIAASTMARTFQQQHDFVQQARAAVLDAVTDGVMMVLPNTSAPDKDAAHVLTVNQSFSRLFKINPAQAQGLSITQVVTRMQIPQDARGDLTVQWKSVAVRDPAVQQGEFNMMNPDGFPGAIEWYSAPVYHNNRVMGRMYIFHDASATRTAATLRANFISRVSHELRTPLTSIRGFAQFILEEMGDDLPDLAREYTEIILNSARHLNALFTDVIEITRADTGEMNLHRTQAHLPDLIIDVAALLELQYKGRGQQMIMELDDNLPPIRVDVNRIMQVLTNLLSNAIKYAPADTRIRIRTELVSNGKGLPTSAPADVMIPAILVTVTDEGPGLLAEDAEQVFMPFYRAKAARAAQIEGTGLGLTIARSIIELHRGKLWAEPRKRGRRGARFLFTMPTAEGE